MSASVAPLRARAERIWSYVVPAAPFIVMPSANDALRGEMKTLASARSGATVRKSENENSFAAPTTFVSFALSARGRASRVTGAAPPLGSLVALRHEAESTRPAATKSPRREREHDMSD